MCHPVPLEFLKVLLACTMVSHPPSPARPAHVSFVGGGEGGLTVKQIVYLLFCSLEVALVPTFSSCLSFAVQKFIWTYILEKILSSRARKIVSKHSICWSVEAVLLPGFLSILSSATCKMLCYLPCLHLIFSGVEPGLMPCLLHSFFYYRVHQLQKNNKCYNLETTFQKKVQFSRYVRFIRSY